MITICPLCQREFGLTHGDQLWKKEICQECLEAEDKAANE